MKGNFDPLLTHIRRIITPLVKDPSRDLVLIGIIVTRNNNNNSSRIDIERRERIVTSLVTIANSEIGGCICRHLLMHGATTMPELEEIVPTSIQSASRIIKKLIQFDIVEHKGFVERPYRKIKQPGPKVRVFVLKGADPQAAIDAQRRHAELRIIKTTMAPDLIRQSKLPEALNLAKIYMDDRDLKIIPNSSILMPMLKTHGIIVNYSQLLTALAKEGYSA